MNTYNEHIAGLPPEQQAIRDRCFHPTGRFIKFEKEDIEQSIPDRFEQQVRKYPDHLAVKTSDEHLTYAELNKASNRMTYAILALLGESREPVALLMEQGPQLIGAILGVLKTGNAYLSLDPQYPHERLAYMLEDSQAGFILTNSRNFPLAKSLARGKRRLLNVDELDSSLSTENPGVSISPDAPVYIIYTSGSTGSPKGVFQNHRNVLHEIMSYTNEYHICAADRLTLLSSSSFIGAARDIFGALLNGAAILPFNLEEVGFPKLAQWLGQEEITIYRSVATAFRQLVDTLTEGRGFLRLRLLILTGEPVYRHDVELYKKYFSSKSVLNARLGSTETLSIRWYFVDKDTQVTNNIVPAGYPVQDQEVLLFDDGHEVGVGHMQTVEHRIAVKGTAGELATEFFERFSFAAAPGCNMSKVEVLHGRNPIRLTCVR